MRLATLNLGQFLKFLKKSGLSLAWLFIFFWGLIWFLSSTLLSVRTNWSLPDFKALYTSGLYFWETGNAYPENASLIFSQLILINSSPPPAMLVFLVLCKLPIELTLLVWYFFSFGVFGYALSRLWKIYPTTTGFPYWPLLFLFMSGPFFLFTYLANWAGLITACVLLAWYYLRKGDDLKGGIFLGLSLLIRVQPGILLFFLLATRRWKATLVTLLTSAVFYLIAWLVLGTDNYVNWLSQSAKVLLSVDVVYNRYQHSWFGLTSSFWALFTGQAETEGAPRWLYYGLSLVTLALVVPLSRKVAFERGFTMVAIASLLVFTPTSEYYYLLLVLPLAMLWQTHPWVCGFVTLRLLAHNSTFFINFGAADNFIWTFSLIVGMLLMLFWLYRDGVKTGASPDLTPTSVSFAVSPPHR